MSRRNIFDGRKKENYNKKKKNQHSLGVGETIAARRIPVRMVSPSGLE